MKVCLKKFDPTTMKRHRIILFVGKRGTGKSVLMNDMLYHFRNVVDFGIAFSPTEETAESFRRCMPEQWIYSSFDPTKLESMLRMQRNNAKQGRMRDLFLVMDDCMFDKKVLKGTGIRDLFMNGRHLHLTYFNAMQYVMDMGPDLRTQVDYVFALRENIISNKVKLWKYFFGMFENFNDFSKVMDKCTQNYSCIVLDNTKNSNNVEDCIFWYKASLEVPKFSMGKELYWKMAQSASKSKSERMRSEVEEMMKERMKTQSSQKKQPLIVRKEDGYGNIIDESDSD